MPNRTKERYSDLYPNIDVKKFRAKLRHDPDTGRLWREYKPGEWRIIKREQHRVPGYIFHFDTYPVQAHDAVWLLHHGKWPKERIVARDGDLKNTRIDNLVLESEIKDHLGHYYVIPDGNGRFQVVVYHDPYFRRKNVFRTHIGADAWGRSQLLLYNQYAYATTASATRDSNYKELPVRDVWVDAAKGVYVVKVRFNEQRKHYGYYKNLEDALEAKIIGQAEVNEIWGEDSENFVMPYYPAPEKKKKKESSE